MRFDVYNPCILRRVFFLVGEVEQHIETGEVLVVLDHSLSLLLLEDIYLANRLDEGVYEFLLRFTKNDALP